MNSITGFGIIFAILTITGAIKNDTGFVLTYLVGALIFGCVGMWVRK